MRLQPGHPTVEALLSSKQLETSGIAEVMSMAGASQQQQQQLGQGQGQGSSLAPRTMRGVPEVIYFSNVTRLQPVPAGRSPAADGLRYRMTLKWGGTNPRLPQLHGADLGSGIWGRAGWFSAPRNRQYALVLPIEMG